MKRVISVALLSFLLSSIACFTGIERHVLEPMTGKIVANDFIKGKTIFIDSHDRKYVLTNDNKIAITSDLLLRSADYYINLGSKPADIMISGDYMYILWEDGNKKILECSLLQVSDRSLLTTNKYKLEVDCNRLLCADDEKIFIISGDGMHIQIVCEYGRIKSLDFTKPVVASQGYGYLFVFDGENICRYGIDDLSSNDEPNKVEYVTYQLDANIPTDQARFLINENKIDYRSFGYKESSYPILAFLNRIYVFSNDRFYELKLDSKCMDVANDTFVSTRTGLFYIDYSCNPPSSEQVMAAKDVKTVEYLGGSFIITFKDEFGLPKCSYIDYRTASKEIIELPLEPSFHVDDEDVNNLNGFIFFKEYPSFYLGDSTGLYQFDMPMFGWE